MDKVTRSLQGLQINMAGLQGTVDDKTSDSGVTFTTFNESPDVDPPQWLRHFNNCAEFKGYDAKRQLQALKILLKGGPATWFDKFLSDDTIAAQDDDQKLASFKVKFLERFDCQNQWLQHHLLNFIYQRPSDSVHG